ncbi:hypothetical protein Dimus_028965, partial [Dionaea muscipula]
MKSRNQKKKKSRNQATGEPNKSSNGELDNNGVYRFQIADSRENSSLSPSIRASPPSLKPCASRQRSLRNY